MQFYTLYTVYTKIHKKKYFVSSYAHKIATYLFICSSYLFYYYHFIWKTTQTILKIELFDVVTWLEVIVIVVSVTAFLDGILVCYIVLILHLLFYLLLFVNRIFTVHDRQIYSILYKASKSTIILFYFLIRKKKHKHL